MIDRTHPERWEEMKAKKAVHDDHFRRGIIGEPTYMLSLKILGFLPHERKSELRDRLNEMGKIK